MRRAFRIVAGVLGVAVIGLTLPFAVGTFFSDVDQIHRLHGVAGVFASGLLLGGSLLVCARKPESMIGPFWVAVASGVASTIAGLISGDFITGLWFIAPISLVILIALHPERRSLFAIGGVDPAAAAMAALALVPAVAYALTQSELQRNGSPLDPHVEFHHYSGMASYALSLPLAALAAALRLPGRRIAVWIVGVTGAGLGLASLLLSDYVGAFDPVWAWLALAWGVVFVAVAQPRRGSA
ncbi:MAG TPA: hypothetical protein VJ573_00500 [Actinomycetota bacterium]|nr:hypothetical protein [Actinomycetota bacterium]